MPEPAIYKWVNGEYRDPESEAVWDSEGVEELHNAGVGYVKPGDTLTRLPNNGLIFYRDSQHRYFWVGDKLESLTSVTSVLKVLDKPALVHAAWKLGAEGKDYRKEWKGAADRGTSVHAALEELAAGVVPDVGAFPDEDRGYVQGLVSAWLDLSPVVAASEVCVASRDLGVAGRFDLLAAVGGEPTLIDLKSNRKAAVYDSHHLQVAAYAHLMVESGWGAPAGTAVLAVGEDGSYRFVKGEASAEDFLSVLGAQKAVRGLERRLKAAA